MLSGTERQGAKKPLSKGNRITPVTKMLPGLQGRGSPCSARDPNALISPGRSDTGVLVSEPWPQPGDARKGRAAA